MVIKKNQVFTYRSQTSKGGLDDVDVHKKSFFKRQNVCGGCGDAFQPEKRFHKMNKK